MIRRKTRKPKIEAARKIKALVQMMFEILARVSARELRAKRLAFWRSFEMMGSRYSKSRSLRTAVWASCILDCAVNSIGRVDAKQNR